MPPPGNVKLAPIELMFTIRPWRCSRMPGITSSLADPEQPEDVGLELPADILGGDGLDRSRLGVAGVVDQHADSALLGADALDRGLHRLLAGDVQRERVAAELAEVLDRLLALAVA